MADASKQSPKPQRSLFGLFQYLLYRSARAALGIVAVFVFHLRCVGRENTYIPGGALILSTHQSHFDPVLVGVTFNERLNFLAKRSLFKSRLLGGVITLLNAIELDRDRSGLAGLKETLKRLKRGEKVLVFPEGTRSADGLIGPLKPGFLSVARRSRVPLIPVAITGAFDALPRGNRIPLRYPMRVAVGQAISAEQVASLDDAGVLALLTQRLHECFQQAQASRIS